MTQKVEKFELPKLGNTNEELDTIEVKEEYLNSLKDTSKEESSSKEEVTQVHLDYKAEIILLKEEIDSLKKVIIDENKEVQVKIENINFKPIEDKLETITSNILEVNTEFKRQADLLLEEDISNNILKLMEYGKHLDEKIDKIQDKNTTLVKKILQKILNKEITENSEKIVTNTFDIIYDKIKSCSKIELYISPKDYKNISDNYVDNKIVKIISDNNIKPGHSLIISDNENFDNNLDKRLDLILESIF